MRKLLAWLGAATLIVVFSALAHAGNGTALKPYVTLILDTSGSMSNATGSGPPSCGGTDSKLNHARCAINNMVNSYGDMVFAFGRFREIPSGTVSGTCPAGCGLSQNACTRNDDRFELMTSLVDGNNSDAAKWVDFTCNTCTPSIPFGVGEDPEVWNAAGSTPITGSLKGAERYYQGLQATLGHCAAAPATTCATIGATGGACAAADTCVATTLWPAGSAGYDPILNDPTNSVFLAQANTGTSVCNPNQATCSSVANCVGANCCCVSQCRPYIVIMLTDGDETCTGTNTTGTCSGLPANTTCYIDQQCPAGQTCTGAGTEGIAAAAMLSANVHAFAVTSVTRAANVVTVVTATAHTFVVGNSVVINNAADATFDGTFTIATVADTTHFTFAQVGANAGPIASLAGTQLYAALNDPVAITAISRTGGIVTVTTAAHTLQVTQNVVIAGVTDASFNGTFAVVGPPTAPAPTATTFSYVQAVADAASSGGTASHAAMLYKYQIQTKPIGFGTGDPYANIEYIAHAGGAADLAGDQGYYANDEAGLELAISTIVAKSLRSETCNNLDDDCDLKIDEDFPTKGNACTNNEQGVCRVDGHLVCRIDGTGVTCDAGTSFCTNANGTTKADGTACTVVNEALATVNGTCSSGVCDPLPGQTASGEICGNNLDDDCDGLVDEGCGSCVPQGESCDATDQDCDNHPDQSCRCSNNANQICKINTDCGIGTCVCAPLVRNCGTGTCLGTQVCGDTNGDQVFDTVNGVWGACNAPPVCTPGHCSIATATACTLDSQCPVGQTCNNAGPDCGICDGKDNDCDGICDGFSEGCSTYLTANGPATDNPGDPSHNPIPQNQCHPGQKTCPQLCAPSNSFGSCLGEVLPTAEICDGVDNDCDNVIDEDFVGTACSSNCGVGTTQCVNGQIVCNASAGTVDNTCDNIDDDCDGKIDEDWVCDSSAGCVGPNCCKCGTGTTCEQTKCIAGVPTCVTSPPITVEVCNCLDDNCNNQIDEGAVCGNGASCVNCQCAFACSPGEFPCPLGKKCVPEGVQGNFCVNDPCYGVTCPAVNGNAQTCFDNGDNTHSCVDICSLQCNAANSCPSDMSCVGGVCGCPSPLACFPPTGECLPNDCTTYPDRCTADQNCINGNCVTNLCQGVTCPTDQYCVAGQCYGSCANVDCPSGQRCHLGTCETDPCGHPCPFGKVCNDTTGQCIEDPCKFRDCPQGQWCNPNDGQCEDDPCVGTKCPVEGQICKGGTCYDPSEFLPDAGGETHVTVGGGGCNTSGGSGGAWLLVGAVAMLMRRRRNGGAS